MLDLDLDLPWLSTPTLRITCGPTYSYGATRLAPVTTSLRGPTSIVWLQVLELPWLTPPPSAGLDQARRLLSSIGALRPHPSHTHTAQLLPLRNRCAAPRHGRGSGGIGGCGSGGGGGGGRGGASYGSYGGHLASRRGLGAAADAPQASSTGSGSSVRATA